MTCVPFTRLGHHTETSAPRPVCGGDLNDGSTRDDGRFEGGCVAFQVSDQLARAQVAIGIGSGVAPGRQPGHPVRGEQVQGIPPLATPALGYPTPIEDDMITCGVGEQPAHGQAGMPGANHEGVNAGHGRWGYG